MATKPGGINLLRKTNTAVFDQFVDWALSIGRFVIILTEIIALSAFLYRFSLDRKIVDLHAQIKDQQIIVQSLKKNEDTYRNLQDRLILASNFSNAGTEKNAIIKDVFSFAPEGIKFNSFTMDETNILLNLQVDSTAALNYFVNSLKTYPPVTSVSIDSVENKQSSSGVTVVITASLSKSQYDAIK